MTGLPWVEEVENDGVSSRGGRSRATDLTSWRASAANLPPARGSAWTAWNGVFPPVIGWSPSARLLPGPEAVP